MLLIGKKFLSILKHNQRTPITRSAKIMGQKPTKLKRSDSCICGQFANHDCSCVFVCHCATESSLVPSLLVSQAPMTPHFSPLEIFTSTQVRHLGRRQCSCQAQLHWKNKSMQTFQFSLQNYHPKLHLFWLLWVLGAVSGNSPGTRGGGGGRDYIREFWNGGRGWLINFPRKPPKVPDQ